MEMVNMIVEAYISVYGAEKWIGLNEKEKHDAIMYIANDLNNRIK